MNGTIRIRPTTSNYTEGIRIHPYSEWSIIMLLGPDVEADDGRSPKSWGMFNHAGSLFLNKDGSDRHTGDELCNVGGNWGIGTVTPSVKLHVAGDTRIEGNLVVTGGVTSYGDVIIDKNNRKWYVGTGAGNGTTSLNFFDKTGSTVRMWLDISGNLTVTGGVTMYSDIRKKTKLGDVELTLREVAEAPLIAHYYKSDEGRTKHVGSVAQYWAGLNDWFCKADGEGYLTMEVQNAALASAISVARELVRHETDTDRRIRTLAERVRELEEEIITIKKEKGE